MMLSAKSDEGQQARIHGILSLVSLEYKFAKRALRRMEFMLEHPPIARMPSLLLYGDTNNGKTVIAETFVNRHKPQDRETEEAALMPVAYVQAPPGGREAQLFEPLHLERWQYGDEYLSLLASFERKIGLEHPSKLYSMSIARQIYAMSEGLLGKIARIIKASAIYAISTGEERITLSTLSRIEFVPPSKRR
jgi:hypothetical protein